MSSFALVFLGVYGHFTCVRYGIPLKRFAAAFFMLFSVGVGSTLFHASLRFHLQLLDEVPMLCGTMALIFICIEDELERKYPGPALPAGLLAFSLAEVGIYLWFPALYFIFLAGYISSLLTLTVLSYRKLSDPRLSDTTRWIYRSSAVSYFSGAALWLADNAVCEHVGAFKFHAWWHVLAAWGTYLWVCFGIAVRADRAGSPYRFGAPAPALPVSCVVVKVGAAK